MAKSKEEKKPETEEAQSESALDRLKAAQQPTPMRCLEHDTVVYYRGGVVNRASSEHAIVERLYDDGETVDLLLAITGGQMPTPGVSHISRLGDTDNPLSEDAIKLRGLWATREEHSQLWQKDQRDRVDRVRRQEAAELAETERKAKLRTLVIEEASKEGANFELIANKYQVHVADIREWLLATVS